MRRGGDEREERNASEIGLTYGIGPWHIHALCENSWIGGRQYTPAQVGAMTLDEIMMLLADRDLLKDRNHATQRAKPLAVAGLADKEGKIAGRDHDGKPIRLRVSGKSKARMLMEEAAKKRREEKKDTIPLRELRDRLKKENAGGTRTS